MNCPVPKIIKTVFDISSKMTCQHPEVMFAGSVALQLIDMIIGISALPFIGGYSGLSHAC